MIIDSSQLRREVSVGLLQSISTHSLNLTEMMGGLRSYENRPYRSEVNPSIGVALTRPSSASATLVRQ